MQLSKRLTHLIDFIPKCNTVADVGTDHGYVPIALVENGIAKKAFAMDVRKGPLERAVTHIRERGLEDLIEARLSDGLEKLHPGEVEGVIIAGMGGELMTRIMENGKDVISTCDFLVLSPHSEAELVREYLPSHGFVIVREDMVEEEGKYYTMMLAEKQENGEAGESYTLAELKYGRLLIEESNPVLLNYLKERERVYNQILENLEGEKGKGAVRRKEQIRWELTMIASAKDGGKKYDDV